MNWITPVQLDMSVLTPGATITLTTPALTRTSEHGIRIIPNWYTISHHLIAIQCHMLHC